MRPLVLIVHLNLSEVPATVFNYVEVLQNCIPFPTYARSDKIQYVVDNINVICNSVFDTLEIQLHWVRNARSLFLDNSVQLLSLNFHCFDRTFLIATPRLHQFSPLRSSILKYLSPPFLQLYLGIVKLYLRLVFKRKALKHLCSILLSLAQV